MTDAIDYQKMFARLFRGSDGDLALDYLRRMTLDQALGPQIGDSHLRHLEGQRFIVRHIINLVQQGRKE